MTVPAPGAMRSDPTALRVVLHTTWSDHFLRLERLRPRGAPAAFLDWQADDGPIDAGVPPPLAAAVARALVRLGGCVFRWQGPATWPEADATVLRPSPAGFAPMMGRVLGRGAPPLVMTRQASVAAALFDYAWEFQGQAAFVVSEETAPGPVAPSNAAYRDLASRDDWRDYVLAPPVRLFLAPAVDGDGILFAASDATVLGELGDDLSAACAEAGLAFEAS